jgi:hypothetical protein
VHQGEPDLVTDGVVAPELVDDDLVVFTQPAGDVDHSSGYV